MREEEIIKALYHEMYRGMIRKDRTILEKVLDSSFVLVHMTGIRQPREVYIHSIENGTLNYYSESPADVSVTIHGTTAKLVGKSMVSAAVFGGGRHTWRLRQDIDLMKSDGAWKMKGSVASTF